MLVRIVPSTPGAPAGKLAEAEVYFDESAGPFSGLKLVGFTVWKSTTGSGPNVTFPARQYSVNGERRHYWLLRTAGDTSTIDPLRDHILRAYADHVESGGPVEPEGRPSA
jgi:hypothetical protein